MDKITFNISKQLKKSFKVFCAESDIEMTETLNFCIEELLEKCKDKKYKKKWIEKKKK